MSKELKSANWNKRVKMSLKTRWMIILESPTIQSQNLQCQTYLRTQMNIQLWKTQWTSHQYFSQILVFRSLPMIRVTKISIFKTIFRLLKEDISNTFHNPKQYSSRHPSSMKWFKELCMMMKVRLNGHRLLRQEYSIFFWYLLPIYNSWQFHHRFRKEDKISTL